MAVELVLTKAFGKAAKTIKKPAELAKVHDSIECFREQGSSAAHFKYLPEIDKTLKAKGLVLARLQPLAAAKAHGAFRILLREDAKNGRYTVPDIQPHENCYRNWKRKYKAFL